jgi:hypothetical protein
MSPEQKARAYQKTRTWIKTQSDYYRKVGSKSREKLRSQVFAHYGNQCACCGLDDPRFLTVDHINNDGSQHRRDTGLTSGIDFYRWLRKHNYPEGFQLLCYNCNCAKSRFGGVCPHQSDKIEAESVAPNGI